MGKKQKTLAEKRADFLAELALTSKVILSAKKKNLKSVSLERMADLYLAALAGSKNKDVFLNDVLEEHSIYFTIDSIEQCHSILTEKGFIIPAAFGFSTFKISKAASVWERRFAKTWKIPLYKITDAGLHFVMGGQELDSTVRDSRLVETKKWDEKIIGALLTLLGGIILLLLKLFFIDKK